MPHYTGLFRTGYETEFIAAREARFQPVPGYGFFSGFSTAT